jgi:hypothetical protein
MPGDLSERSQLRKVKPVTQSVRAISFGVTSSTAV